MPSKSKRRRMKKMERKLESRLKRLARAKRFAGVTTTDIGASLARRESLDNEGLGILGAPLDYSMEAKMMALARGTDALVTKVVNAAAEGAVDATEHLLDLSQAYYREETDQGQHNVQCDRCLLKSPGAATRSGASTLAVSLGWVVTEAFDHCPVCKDGGLMLPGASVALRAPPALTPAEMILVVRLRYIIDKIDRGASVPAFLQNAARSGHRSMLSDLAQETNYDTTPLIEKLTALTEQRGVDVHDLLHSDAARVWAFLFELYGALKKEDQG